MVGKAWLLLGLSWIAGLPLWAAPAATPMHVIVTVINKHADPGQPVPNVRVTIDFVDGSQKITEARDRTNSQGQTELIISPEAQQRGDLHIEITDAPNLVIFQPGEGILTDVHPTLTIVLLPKGSPALLQPAQIEAMLNRLSRLSIQNQQLQVSLTKAEHQKPDFDQLLHNWASTNGLPYDQVDQQMRAWANDVLEHRQEASLSKQAEAELALRHFENAAKLFQGAALTSKLALHREQESYLVGRREALRSLFKESTQGADAFQLAHQYHQATQIMDDAVTEAAAEHQHFPEDAALRHIWLRTVRYTSLVRTQEGEKLLSQDPPSENAAPLFLKAIDDCKGVLAQTDKSAEPEQWASVQFVIGSAELYLGVHVPNYKDATEFRSQAIASIRAALDASNKDKDPKTWATYVIYYALTSATANMTSYQDGHLPADQAVQSLSQCVDELRSVLVVRSRAENPMEWGQAQMVIGNLLTLEAMIIPGQHATEFLAQAETSTRAATEVFTRADHPDEWSMAEKSLGSVLFARSINASGNQAHDLALQGAAAIQASLQASATRDDPLDWASAQHNLAILLSTKSNEFSGDQAIDLMAQAIVASRFELQVITKASLPLRWAETQYELGSGLTRIADLYNSQGQASQYADYRSQAAAAFRAALEVFNRQNNANRWAHTQWALGNILFAQSQADPANPSTDLLAQSANALSGALEVITWKTSPQDWGSIQNTLGHIRAAQGLHSSGPQAKDFFTQSAEALTAALQIVPKNAETLSLLSSLYHDYLLDFPKAYDYAARAEVAAPADSNKLNLAEAALTTSNFSSCIDLVNSVNPVQLDPRLTHGRLMLLLACQWGAGQRAAASQTADALAASASTLAKQQGWSTSGDRVYLSSALEFSANRSAWIKLFQSLEQGDGPSLAEASHTLQRVPAN
jgi:tetratricopeptide (TPR) repeat protein